VTKATFLLFTYFSLLFLGAAGRWTQKCFSESCRVTAGVEFIDENGGGPGVRLRKRQLKKG
jgi:hypothetical protein